MKNKNNGFTLAEILIVLTIIGVMAVMTIPSLVQNSNSQHKIALFKKAYNSVSNAYATEFAIKSAPKIGTDIGVMANALANQLNIKYFVNINDENKTKIYEKPKQYLNAYWMVTEDGIAYYVHSYNQTKECMSRLEINKYTDGYQSQLDNCMEIFVDINGPEKGNDTWCWKGSSNLNNCDKTVFLVAKDGITSGNPDCTSAGRIINDLPPYDTSKCGE